MSPPRTSEAGLEFKRELPRELVEAMIEPVNRACSRAAWEWGIRHRQDREDLQQTVWRKLTVAHARQPLDPSKVGGLIRVTAATCAIDAVKRRIRRKPTMSLLDEHAAMREPDPETAIIHAEILTHLTTFYSQKQVEAVHLYAHGVAHKDIAAQLGETVGVIRRWLREILRDLRNKFGTDND